MGGAMKLTKDFAFERKYQEILNRFYIARGIKYQRISGSNNRKGDLILDGILTEEKGLRRDNSLAYEIVQALELFREVEFGEHYCRLPIKALGNQFITKAKQQIWICYDGDNPNSIYRVNKIKLDSFYMRPEMFSKYPPRPITAGYGLTLTAHIPWLLLLKYEVARKLWSVQPELFGEQ